MLTPNEAKDIEQFIRIGAAAAKQGKTLEEDQKIGQVAMHLIVRLQTVIEPETPKAD